MADVKAVCIAVQRKFDTGENVQVTLGDITLLNTGKLFFFFFNFYHKLNTVWDAIAHRERKENIKEHDYNTIC